VNELAFRSAPVLELPDSLEVVLEGSVSPAAATGLRERMEGALGRSSAYLSILMGGVNYVASAGLAYLMDLAGRMERRGGAVVLVGVQPKVKVVLNNLGMASFFRLEDSAEHARAFLRAQAERVFRSPRVRALDGDEAGTEFPVVGTAIKIGGDPRSTIAVKHPQVESRHCEIYRTGDRCFVRDLGTRFGTWVGMRKVNDEALSPGDVIKIGALRLAYVPPGVRHQG
jgi:anti-anti-sigma factor